MKIYKEYSMIIYGFAVATISLPKSTVTIEIRRRDISATHVNRQTVSADISKSLFDKKQPENFNKSHMKKIFI